MPALHAFNDSLTYLAGLALLHKAKAHVIAQTDWCMARRPRPGARLSYPGKKDKKISYMLSRRALAPASISVERYRVLDVLEETGDGRGAWIARSRLVLQRNTFYSLQGLGGPDRRELIDSGLDLDLLRRGVDLGLGDLIRRRLGVAFARGPRIRRPSPRVRRASRARSRCRPRRDCDAIRVADCREPVGHQHDGGRRARHERVAERGLDLRLSASSADVASSKSTRGSLRNARAHRYPLFLAAGNPHAAPSDPRVVASRKGLQTGGRSATPRRPRAPRRRPRPPPRRTLCYRIWSGQNRVLRHNTKLPPQQPHVELRQRHAVDRDLAAARVVEPQQEVERRRLARAGPAN